MTKAEAIFDRETNTMQVTEADGEVKVIDYSGGKNG